MDMAEVRSRVSPYLRCCPRSTTERSFTPRVSNVSLLLYFSISAQNKARTNTANCCQGQLLEEYPLARDALPVLSSRLIHDDKKSVQATQVVRLDLFCGKFLCAPIRK